MHWDISWYVPYDVEEAAAKSTFAQETRSRVIHHSHGIHIRAKHQSNSLSHQQRVPPLPQPPLSPLVEGIPRRNRRVVVLVCGRGRGEGRRRRPRGCKDFFVVFYGLHG